MGAISVSRLRISDERVGRFVLLCMGLGFFALVLAGAATVWSVGRNQVHLDAVTHTHAVVRRLSYVQTLSERLETARRGMLLSNDPRYPRVFAETEAGLTQNVDILARLVDDNPAQVRRIAELRAAVRDQQALVGRSRALMSEAGTTAAIREFRAEIRQAPILAIRAVTRAMQLEESRLLDMRNAQQRSSVMALYAVIGVSAVMVVLVALASLAVMRRSLREAQSSAGALKQLNANLEDAVNERTTDLRRANDEIQRFAYIVSHDLRSPLVNVMGFTAELEAATKPLAALVDRVEAEAPALMVEDAREAARQDLPEAVRFIRTSTQKMDRLINAILKLSREGRRVLTPEPIDLAALAEGVAATLAHRADEVGADIRVIRPLPTLTHDRLAVEQILGNLVENAVKYRSPGRPLVVEIRGRAELGRVLIQISDNGRGIEAKDHARIFDLFRRSGAQTEPGEGIGLAHVRALAYRMGGTVECQSEFGQGSTFTFTLPAVYHGEPKSDDAA